MSLQVLLDISNASSRSIGQARRYAQPALTDGERRDRRNELRRQRLRHLFLEPGQVLQRTTLTDSIERSPHETASVRASTVLNSDGVIANTVMQDAPVKFAGTTEDSSPLELGALYGGDIFMRSARLATMGCDDEQQIASNSSTIKAPKDSSLQAVESKDVAPIEAASATTRADAPSPSEEPLDTLWMQNVVDECSTLAYNGIWCFSDNEPSLFRLALAMRLSSATSETVGWEDIHHRLFPYLGVGEPRTIKIAYPWWHLHNISHKMCCKVGVILRHLVQKGDIGFHETKKRINRLAGLSIVLAAFGQPCNGLTSTRFCSDDDLRLVRLLIQLQDETLLRQKIGAQAGKWKRIVEAHVTLGFRRYDMSNLDWGSPPVGPPHVIYDPDVHSSQHVSSSPNLAANGIPMYAGRSRPGTIQAHQSIMTQDYGSYGSSFKTTSSVYSFNKWMNSMSSNGSIRET